MRSGSTAVHNPDVLIVGGGLAAMTAALAVLEQGRMPTVISNGAVGRSGNTMVAGGGIASATTDDGNQPRLYQDDLLRSGKGLSDPALVSCMADDSPDMLERLIGYGVPLQRPGGKWNLRLAPGHSTHRNIPVDGSGVPFKLRGSAFMIGPLQRLAEAGVPMADGLRAAAIETDDAGVSGLWVFDRKNGQSRYFSCRRIILATGGFGGLYLRNNNVSNMLGDGAAVALQAGAVLRDMEMVQFFPTMMYDPCKMAITNTLYGSGAVVRNRDGERFLSRYDPDGDLCTRDAMARAIFLEVKAGRGVDGCAYVDCTAIPPDILEGQFGNYKAHLAKHGLDMGKDWLKGTPCTHYTLGGIRVDVDGRTGVDGLYAAGEVTGGVHGVNRLAGAALMEVAVFGRRAGLAASSDDRPEHTARTPASRAWSAADREDQLKQLKTIMWQDVSLAREENGLRSALEQVLTMREQEEAGTGNVSSLFNGPLLVAEAVIRSALARKESRGAHYRTDFPQTAPGDPSPVLVSYRNGQVCVDA